MVLISFPAIWPKSVYISVVAYFWHITSAASFSKNKAPRDYPCGGTLVVSFTGINQGFWSHTGYWLRNASIFRFQSIFLVHSKEYQLKNKYILLNVLLSTIAAYFYELCRIWRSIKAQATHRSMGYLPRQVPLPLPSPWSITCDEEESLINGEGKQRVGILIDTTQQNFL